MRTLLFLLAILSIGLLPAISLAEDKLPPIIPRDVLFGNPERAGTQISPDGKHLSYLAPDEKNVLQVWVRSRDKDDARKVTNDPKRGIRQYFWAYDNKNLIYLQDTGGDENFHLFAVELATGETRELTPYKDTRVQGVFLDEKFPTTVAFMMNQRDKTAFDLHKLDLATGKEELVEKNPGNFVGLILDAQMQPRAGLTMSPADGVQTLMVRDKVNDPWRKLRSWPSEEQGGPLAFSLDGNSIYVIANHDANTERLLKVDISTGKEEVIAADAEFDVSNAFMDRKRRIPLAVAFDKARTEWKTLDNSVEEDFKVLSQLRRGDFNVTSATLDDQTWIVSYNADDGPATAYLYDRANKKATYLYSNNSKLEKIQLARMEPIEFKAQDGLLVRGYLTLPVGVEPKNLPTVLLVHGGPWARDAWGYNPLVQFLANRGYAVLQVNFRGSTGYGKQFLNAGNKEWAGKMHQDLIDAVDWAVQKGYSNPKKVAIMGGSYGGYATLVGLTFTPDKFACGVDIVGPSSIITLLKSIPPYWAPMMAVFTKRVGDLKTEESFLRERSPLFKADKIKVPLLIGQGKNDPRVKQPESDQIYDAMKKAGLPVQYVIYADEGHGFQRPENRLHFFAITEKFLYEHLGGRAEELGNMTGHSATVK
ncbi:MAG TPA: S9 family peptidase [Gemmatales bacterium]|nr:S9 family peptidase [Gemmatales bacterium]